MKFHIDGRSSFRLQKQGGGARGMEPNFLVPLQYATINLTDINAAAQ
jgi:hypothetical protein